MIGTIRSAVRIRANNCCEYCFAQAAFSHDPFSEEHILPVSKGGLYILENLAWACLGCNFFKGAVTFAIDFLTGSLVPLFNPRKDVWDTHFEWNEDFTNLNGLTPTGRATITRLKLNRPGLINFRKVLVNQGKHPPR